jgi:P27 family predicted phage terminase small subunit
MGNWNSGRRPQPTALKVLRGNPGKRPLNPREPRMPRADPTFDTPPAALADDPGAIAEWIRVAPMLRAAGLVTESERAALTALCQQWSRYLAAHAQVIALGMVIESAKLVPIPNPYLLVADRALTHCHRLWNELGLTPAGRARAMKVPAADEPHTKGPSAGEPFRLRPWQEKKIIRPLFKINPATGRRQYRMCLLMMPRKNGKTEIIAALAIDGLMFDHEMGAEVYSAAADKDQASLAFNVAAQMVRNDPELLAQCDILDSTKRIIHRKSGSFYRAISAEAYSKHGLNASRVLFDEVHAQPNRELWDVLTSSTGARAQPLTVAISTAGYDRHSILWELYSHAQNVIADPTLDPAFLPIIFEAPIGSDWTDEKIWHACNPALGDFRSLDEMRAACARAKEIPAQENAFRRLYLNQWTEQASRWINLPSWDACKAPIDRASLRGRRCFVGLDLSSNTDLTAAVAVFPDGDHFDVLAHFFVPRDRIAHRTTRDRVPYEQWARDGWITATPGPVVDYDYVRNLIAAWDQEFDVRIVAYDPWNAVDLMARLEKQDGIVCVKVRQGIASLSAPSKALESAILSRRIRHDGHPVLRWNIGNMSVEGDAAGNIKPSKDLSTERIDGGYALIMAIDALDRHDATPPTAYQMIIMGP